MKKARSTSSDKPYTNRRSPLHLSRDAPERRDGRELVELVGRSCTAAARQESWMTSTSPAKSSRRSPSPVSSACWPTSRSLRKQAAKLLAGLCAARGLHGTASPLDRLVPSACRSLCAATAATEWMVPRACPGSISWARWRRRSSRTVPRSGGPRLRLSSQPPTVTTARWCWAAITTLAVTWKDARSTAARLHQATARSSRPSRSAVPSGWRGSSDSLARPPAVAESMEGRPDVIAVGPSTEVLHDELASSPEA
jgi:hypothetical protein